MDGKKLKNFVITSAQYSSPVNKNFLKGLELYSKENNAELVVIPMAGRTIDEDEYPLELSNYGPLTRPKDLNQKVKVSDYKIKPQQIDPVTGLARFTQSDVTTIFASPKQRLKVVPNSNLHLPKTLMTTGAITLPNYNDNRIGRIADKDHVYGAIVVEVESPIKYHFRQIDANTNGVFTDLGVRYNGNKDPTKGTLEALVLGDYHVGDTDPVVRSSSMNMIEELKPKRIFLHDFFDGHSVNPYRWNKVISRAKDHSGDRYSLEKELEDAAKELEFIVKNAGKNTEVILVASNHHDFLNYYLQDGQFMKEPHNIHMASKLLPLTIEGKNPVEQGIKMFYKIPDNVRFLKRDDDYKVRGWQLGAHGDKGNNGMRGTINNRETAYGKSITGHTHTPEIQRNTYIVGTSTHLNLDYTSGPSSWMNTHGLLYDDGKAQLVNIIDGKWRKK